MNKQVMKQLISFTVHRVTVTSYGKDTFRSQSLGMAHLDSVLLGHMCQLRLLFTAARLLDELQGETQETT